MLRKLMKVELLCLTITQIFSCRRNVVWKQCMAFFSVFLVSSSSSEKKRWNSLNASLVLTKDTWERRRQIHKQLRDIFPFWKRTNAPWVLFVFVRFFSCLALICEAFHAWLMTSPRSEKTFKSLDESFLLLKFCFLISLIFQASVLRPLCVFETFRGTTTRNAAVLLRDLALGNFNESLLPFGGCFFLCVQ